MDNLFDLGYAIWESLAIGLVVYLIGWSVWDALRPKRG